MQVGILIILGNQEIYFRSNLKVNMMNIVYFSMNISIFSFYEKVTPSLDHAGFSKYFSFNPPTLQDVFNWYLLVHNINNYVNKTNCSFTKKCLKIFHKQTQI